MLTADSFCHLATQAETVVSFLSSRSSEMIYCSRNASRVCAVDVTPEVAVDGVGDVVVGDVHPATSTVPSIRATSNAAKYLLLIFDLSF
jgi:hypothetical protein